MPNSGISNGRGRLGVWLRRALVGCGVLAGGGVAAYFLVNNALSVPPYDGQESDHFADGHFKNPWPIEEHGFADFLRWQLARERGPWREWTDAAQGPPPPPRVEGGRLRVTYVNHATTLVQFDGLNVLTDPVWSERVSPFTWAGPKRVRPPGLRFEDLPRIDAVVISHNHYDHMDVETLKRLKEAHNPRFFVGLGNAPVLERAGVGAATELDWWQSAALGGGVEVVGVPAQHFSGRSLRDRNRALWCGYVIKGPSGVVYFAGDTAAAPHFGQIRGRFGPPRLALLPIGAYLPRWFMRAVHVSPDEAVAAHDALGAKTSVGIHFGTFPLADDGETEAVETLRRALPAGREDFRVLDFGEGRDVP